MIALCMPVVSDVLYVDIHGKKFEASPMIVMPSFSSNYGEPQYRNTFMELYI